MINYSRLKELQKYSFINVIPALLKHGFEEKAYSMSNCGNWLELAHCNSCGTNYLSGFNSCKERFCPICELKRSRLWFAKMVPVVEELLDNKFYLNMITLTIPDNSNLKNGVDLLFSTFRYLTHEDKLMSREFNNRFIGGIRCLEVKKSKNSNMWHPHFHIIVCKSQPSRDFEWLQKAWSKAYSIVSGHETYCSIQVNAFRYKNRKDLLKNVLECCKYVSKFKWHIDNDVEELIEAMKGVRTVSSWGNIRAMLKTDSVEYLMEKSLSDVERLVCSVCGNENFDFIDGPVAKGMSVRDFDKEIDLKFKSKGENYE